jgi:hypothetical protein
MPRDAARRLTAHAVSEFLRRCVRGQNLRRAAITAAIVGPTRTLINQHVALRALIAGETWTTGAWVRTALTFGVPFLVSLTSAAAAGADVRPESG